VAVIAKVTADYNSLEPVDAPVIALNEDHRHATDGAA
jgi:hypothetical protein